MKKGFSQPYKKPNIVFRFLAFVIGLAVVAALIGALAVPVGLAISKGVRTAEQAWQAVPTEVVEPELPEETIFTAADGSIMARFAEFDRRVVSAEQISPWVTKAIVATEDVRYYSHGGVDLVGLMRAVRSNAGSSSTQGGSSITQQYVKNIMLLGAELSGDREAAVAARERTLGRKIAEARRAMALEEIYTKDEIITKYLNLVNFGSSAYGIEAAAQRYFSVSAADLSLSQAATLVGVVNAPSALNPIASLPKATQRRDLVLDRMVSAGYITPQQAAAEKALPIVLNPTYPQRGCRAARADWGHYCDAVYRLLMTSDVLGADEQTRLKVWKRGGLVIRTAMRPVVTREARKAARKYVPSTHRAAAMVAVVQPGTGKVTAITMSRDFGTGSGLTELPLVTTPVTGPGSTMKAFTLSAAMADGIPVSTVLPGGTTYTSQYLKNPESGAFHNYNTEPASNVTIVQSTARSLNTAFIQLSERVGVLRVARLARAMGATDLPLTGDNRITPREGSFTLGAREISVVQMASSYATLAASGLACKPMYILSIQYPGQQAPEEIPTDCSQVLSPAAAKAATWVLQEAARTGTGQPAQLSDRPIAGKTGTSQDVSSAWFVGFTPSWATAVAVADPRGPRYPLVNTLGFYKVYGGSIPAPIFKQTMEALHKKIPPDEMVTELSDDYLLALPPASRVMVPDLRGLPAAAALAALDAAGLVFEGPLPSVVSSSVPRATTLVAVGSSVQLK